MATTKVHDLDELRRRVQRLRLYGLLSAWGKLCTKSWVPELIELEEQERARRSREYRIKNAQIGAFKPVVDSNGRTPRRSTRASSRTYSSSTSSRSPSPQTSSSSAPMA